MSRRATLVPRPIRIARENRAISYVASILRFHEGALPASVAFATDGFHGPGFYAWEAEYPEDGCSFLTADREVLRVAQAIVKHERAAGCFS